MLNRNKFSNKTSINPFNSIRFYIIIPYTFTQTLQHQQINNKTIACKSKERKKSNNAWNKLQAKVTKKKTILKWNADCITLDEILKENQKK